MNQTISSLNIVFYRQVKENLMQSVLPDLYEIKFLSVRHTGKQTLTLMISPSLNARVLGS